MNNKKLFILPYVHTLKISDIAYKQGIVDGFASKPALRQDTGFMVEKT